MVKSVNKPKMMCHLLKKRPAPDCFSDAGLKDKGLNPQHQELSPRRRELTRGNLKHEAVVASPPAAGTTPARAEPLTTITTVDAEEVRAAAGILDRLMHHHEPPDAQLLDVLVREVLTQQAGELGVRGEQSTVQRRQTDLLVDPLLIRPHGSR